MVNTRLFLSYSRTDRPTVDTLVEDLQGFDCEPFFDEKLVGGQAWWEQLLTRIEECQAFLPVLSSEYLESRPCHLEAEYAHSLGKPMLPVALASVSPALFLPCIAEAQWVVYSPNEKNAFRDLVRAVQRLPECPPLPERMPPRPEVPISYMNKLQEQINSPDDLGRTDQVLLLDSLKLRLGGPDDAAARELLRALQARPDLIFRVANEIAALLGTGTPPPQQAPSAPPPTPSASAWPPPPGRSAAQPPGPSTWTQPPHTPPPVVTPARAETAPWSSGAFIGLIIASIFFCGFAGIILGAINRKDPGKNRQATVLLWVGIGVLAFWIVTIIVSAAVSPSDSQSLPGGWHRPVGGFR